MIKAAIETILGLKKDSIVKDDRGVQFLLNSNGGYTELKKTESEHLIPGFRTNSLKSIADYIEQNFDKNENGFVIHVVDYETVRLKSNVLGEENQREQLVEAEAKNPEFRFGTFYDQENFIISLMTKFQSTEGSEYCLAIASGIVDGEEAKLIDNGMSQNVVMKSGIASVSNEEVNPYVSLQPFRTFREIKQPESIFLLRLRKGAQLAVYEADGGEWKQEAVQNIVEYFKDNLNDDQYSILY